MLTAQRDELETELRVIQVERCQLKRDLKIAREQRSERREGTEEGAYTGRRVRVMEVRRGGFTACLCRCPGPVLAER